MSLLLKIFSFYPLKWSPDLLDWVLLKAQCKNLKLSYLVVGVHLKSIWLSWDTNAKFIQNLAALFILIHRQNLTSKFLLTSYQSRIFFIWFMTYLFI